MVENEAAQLFINKVKIFFKKKIHPRFKLKIMLIAHPVQPFSLLIYLFERF